MTDKDDQVALTRGSVATLAALAAIILGVHTAVVIPLVRGISTEVATSKIERHEALASHQGAMPRAEVAAEIKDLRERINQNAQKLATIEALVLKLKD